MLFGKTGIYARHRSPFLGSDRGSGAAKRRVREIVWTRRANRRHPGTSRLFSPQMCHKAVAFRCSGMRKVYLVGQLSCRLAFLSGSPCPELRLNVSGGWAGMARLIGLPDRVSHALAGRSSGPIANLGAMPGALSANGDGFEFPQNAVNKAGMVGRAQGADCTATARK